MKARQHCLSATDIKDLLPFTASGRKRTITDENYLKVYSRKLVAVTDDMCVSVGAMARGHILEPYAIRMFNTCFKNYDEVLYHWDDVVVKEDSGFGMTLGFSPDACDIQPPSHDGLIAYPNFPEELTCIGEVKSYSPEKHMICGYSDKEKLEERWQIAAAMATVPTIEKAHLIFYNPSMTDQMFVHTYHRDDLEDEVCIIYGIEHDWLDFIKKIDDQMPPSELFYGDKKNEEMIVTELEKARELNPAGM